MDKILLSLLFRLIDANRIGRWVQLAVAAALPWLLLRIPFLQGFVGPATEGTIATAMSIFFVGLWNDFAEKRTAPNSEDVAKVLAPAVEALVIPASTAASITAAVVPDKAKGAL